MIPHQKSVVNTLTESFKGEVSDWGLHFLDQDISVIKRWPPNTLVKIDIFNRTALMFACQNSTTDVVHAISEILLGTNEINAVAPATGWSALTTACTFGRYDVAEILLHHGAVPSPMTIICHIESVQLDDELLMHFLHSPAIIPQEWDAIFLAISIGRLCFLNKLGIIPRFQQAMLHLNVLITLRRRNAINVHDVINVDLWQHIQESRALLYVAKRYGDNSRWWLQEMNRKSSYGRRKSDQGIWSMIRNAIKDVFPLKLESMSRIVVLNHLPNGLSSRQEAIETLDMLPPSLKDYLLLKA